MEVKLIKGLQADYTPAEWTGVNTSGLKPYGARVLIRVDACSATTQGGILLTDDMSEKMTLAAETGCIYAVGPFAWHKHDDRPVVGDRVYFERYAGTVARGVDGELYRFMDDGSVSGGLLEQGGAD